jgi:hypothetical protein
LIRRSALFELQAEKRKKKIIRTPRLNPRNAIQSSCCCSPAASLPPARLKCCIPSHTRCSLLPHALDKHSWDKEFIICVALHTQTQTGKVLKFVGNEKLVRNERGREWRRHVPTIIIIMSQEKERHCCCCSKIPPLLPPILSPSCT